MFNEYLGVFLAAFFKIFSSPLAQNRFIKHGDCVVEHFEHKLLIFLLHAHEGGFHSQHALGEDDMLFFYFLVKYQQIAQSFSGLHAILDDVPN